MIRDPASPVSANFTPDAFTFSYQSNSHKYAMSTMKQQVMFSDDSDGLLSICHRWVNQERGSIANGM